MTLKEKLARGMVGVASPLAGAGVSLTKVEAWLRIGSLCVGITVGLLTIVSLVRPMLRERRERRTRPWEN